MVDSDKDWEAWGKTDPYYGVVSHDQFHKGAIEENRSEFFETGQLRIADSLQRLERHFGPIKRRRALDFGCGVGRLTIPLARAFDDVVGLDISPSMLAEAEANAQTSSVHNVVFAPSDDRLSNAPGDFDLVYSYIVLQHIPVVRGMRILENLLDKVRPGGGFALHMSIATGRLRDTLRKTMRYTTIGNYAANLLKGRPIDEPVMQMNEYSPFEIMALIKKRGVDEVVAQPEWHRTCLTVSWLGRMPSA